MMIASLVLALAGPIPAVPAYPGAQMTRPKSKVVIITTTDSADQAKRTYTARMHKAGWVSVLPDGVLNGEVRVPGALLAFEKGRVAADVWISGDLGTQKAPKTVLMVLISDRAKSAKQVPETIPGQPSKDPVKGGGQVD